MIKLILVILLVGILLIIGLCLYCYLNREKWWGGIPSRTFKVSQYIIDDQGREHSIPTNYRLMLDKYKKVRFNDQVTIHNY